MDLRDVVLLVGFGAICAGTWILLGIGPALLVCGAGLVAVGVMAYRGGTT